MRIFVVFLFLGASMMGVISAHSALQRGKTSVSAEASLPAQWLTSPALQISLKSSLRSEQVSQLSALSKSLRTDITLLKKSTKLSATERYQGYRSLLETNARKGTHIILGSGNTLPTIANQSIQETLSNKLLPTPTAFKDQKSMIAYYRALNTEISQKKSVLSQEQKLFYRNRLEESHFFMRAIFIEKTKSQSVK